MMNENRNSETSFMLTSLGSGAVILTGRGVLVVQKSIAANAMLEALSYRLA
jgi:hypothetical protein